jgi:hypothetical protein
MNKNSFYRTAPHPIFTGRMVRLPSKGRLKWLGGNLGLDTPVEEGVIDSAGNYQSMGLKELLAHIDEFEGFRGEMTIQQYLMYCAFEAYEYGLLDEAERTTFESYVNAKMGSVDKFSAARKMLTT